MSEYASEAAVAIGQLAEAIETMAGVMAWGAAAEHSESHGRQKEMAAVIFHIAQQRFKTTKIDGVKVDKATQDELDDMFWFLMGVNRKDLPKGKAR